MLRAFSLLLLTFALAACQTANRTPSLQQRQIAVLKEQGFEQNGDVWELGLPDRLLFDIDASAMRPWQAKRLQGTARALVGVGIAGARVEGNTDSTGTPAYNRELSQRRADAVKNVLVEGGMAESALEAVGLGERNPIGNNRTAAGRQENRRVAIIVRTAAE